MPYKSKAQSRYMHATHPKIAARWDKKQRGPIKINKVRKTGRGK